MHEVVILMSDEHLIANDKHDSIGLHLLLETERVMLDILMTELVMRLVIGHQNQVDFLFVQ